MSLDDRARIARLREVPRTDVALAERVHRFFVALQTRLCREVERLDGVARFAPVPPPGAEGSLVMEGGARFAEGHVAIVNEQRRPPDSGGSGSRTFSVGLVLDLRPCAPPAPSLHAALWYEGAGEDPVRPVAQAFRGEVGLGPGRSAAESDAFFHQAWASVCSRHPDVVDHRDARRARGLAFGPLEEDPEGAFHFVREVGRALGPAYLPLVRRGRDGW